MKKSRNTLRIVSLVIFFLGVLFGAAFFASATWGDLESNFYAFPSYGYRNANVMRCPIFMTTGETGIVTATFKNTMERRVRPNVRLIVSPARMTVERISIESGESQQLEWEVGWDEIGLRNFVFVKIITFAGYPLPNIEQTCGILVLNIPGMTGTQVALIPLICSLLFMFIGVGLWYLAERGMQTKYADIPRAMIMLTVVIILGIVSAYMGWWLTGVILVALLILMIGVVLGSILQGR